METRRRQAADGKQSCAAGTSGHAPDVLRTEGGAIDMDAYTERARRLRRAAISKGLDALVIAVVRQVKPLTRNLRRRNSKSVELDAGQMIS